MNFIRVTVFLAFRPRNGPDLKKTDRKSSGNRAADGRPRFIWLPRMLARVGRQPLELSLLPVEVPLAMDRAYESDETRQLALELDLIPAVPPKSSRRESSRLTAANPQSLPVYLSSVMARPFGVQAAQRATKAKLRRVADIAMRLHWKPPFQVLSYSPTLQVTFLCFVTICEFLRGLQQFSIYPIAAVPRIYPGPRLPRLYLCS